MPDSLPLDLQNLQTKMQSFIDDVLTDIEAKIESNINQPIPNNILDEARIRSIESGIWGLTQPAEFGGSEANILEMTIVREILGQANLRIGNHVLGPHPGILASVKGKLREDYLLPLMKGEKRGAFAFTEAQTIPNGKPTWASLENQELTITGQKSFVSGGSNADFFSTLVNIESKNRTSGTAIVLIDKNSKGLSIEREFRSIDGSSHISIILNSVKVPDWHIVGEIGEGMPRALRNISNVRMAIAAKSTGIASWATQFTVKNIQQPHRSGISLSEREGVRLRLADMLIQVYAMRSILYRTAKIANTNNTPVMNEVLTTKVFCTEQVGMIIDRAIDLCGGSSLIEGHPLERTYRDVRSLRFAEGASDTLRLNLAKDYLESDNSIRF
ncbi:MAG: hypothetical protein CL792_00775 [Chloroflexi bacterium]|nr:hypothetical protein [Chloroflexota bacterium]|tara:strand:+ start:855 stop:2012 length:1158 start_codon:yes stop_codon:yes gene_type:complete